MTDCSARMPEQLAHSHSRTGVIHSDCAEVLFECVRCSQCLRNEPAAISRFRRGAEHRLPARATVRAFADQCVRMYGGSAPATQHQRQVPCTDFTDTEVQRFQFGLRGQLLFLERLVHVPISARLDPPSCRLQLRRHECVVSGLLRQGVPFLRLCRRAEHVLPAAASRDCSTRTAAVLVRSALQRRVSIFMSPHMSVDCLQTRVSPGCGALLGLILARPRGDCIATVQASATLCIAALAASACANKSSVTAINGRIESTGLCAVSPLSFSVCISPNAPTAPQFTHER